MTTKIKSVFRKLPLFVILVLLTVACETPQVYPDEPTVSFKSLVVSEKDGNFSFFTVIHLIDGDGNIGSDDQTTKHLFYDLYALHNGQPVLVELDPPYHMNLPNLEPEGQNKTLIADIEADILLTKQILLEIIPSDTVFFEFYIMDNDSNFSPHEFTRQVILNDETTWVLP